MPPHKAAKAAVLVVEVGKYSQAEIKFLSIVLFCVASLAFVLSLPNTPTTTDHIIPVAAVKFHKANSL